MRGGNYHHTGSWLSDQKGLCTCIANEGADKLERKPLKNRASRITSPELCPHPTQLSGSTKI